MCPGGPLFPKPAVYPSVNEVVLPPLGLAGLPILSGQAPYVVDPRSIRVFRDDCLERSTHARRIRSAHSLT